MHSADDARHAELHRICLLVCAGVAATPQHIVHDILQLTNLWHHQRQQHQATHCLVPQTLLAWLTGEVCSGPSAVSGGAS